MLWIIGMKTRAERELELYGHLKTEAGREQIAELYRIVLNGRSPTVFRDYRQIIVEILKSEFGW